MTKIFVIKNSDRDIDIDDDDCSGWALLLLIPSLPKVSSLMALGTALDRLSGGELFWVYFVRLFFHQFSSSTTFLGLDAIIVFVDNFFLFTI